MPLWKKLTAVVGAVLATSPVWPYLKKGLEWGEHTEFIYHRAHEIGEVAPVLENILNPPTWLPLILLPLGLLLLWLALRRGKSERSSDRVGDAPKQKPDIVQIEFRWKPGGATDPYEIYAIVTIKQNLKDFVVFGHFAVAEHYLSSTSKWLWQPSVRLFKTEDIFQGEVKSLPVIRCSRKDDGNSMMIFNERAWSIKDSQLLLLRMTAVGSSGTQFFQRAFNSQKIGNTVLLDYVDINDIAYVEGAETPAVTQFPEAARPSVDRKELLSLEPQNSDEWRPIFMAIQHIRERIGDTNSEKCWPAARLALRQAAYDKRVKMRSRKQLPENNPHTGSEYSEIFIDIDSDYWTNSDINALATSSDMQSHYHVDPQTAFAWGKQGIYERNRYAELKINWTDVLRGWP
jgi:hypothetical protein